METALETPVETVCPSNPAPPRSDRLVSASRLVNESRVGLYRRLQKLFHHGYLDRLGTNPNAPLVYALGRRGGAMLEVPERKDVGDRYVAHKLMVGDFRVALTLAAREVAIELSWRAVPNDGPVRPDGFFTLRFPELPDGQNRAHFFLEADRSTMSRERFVEKLRAYAAWQNAGGHIDAFGIRRFRVLTVTKSEERLASLLDAVRKSADLAESPTIFWFASAKRFNAERAASIFDPIWETAEAPESAKSILPNPR